MSKSKKSQIVFSIFFIFCGYIISAHRVISYGQTKTDGSVKNGQIFDAKPETVRLKPDKIIVSASASDNEKQLFISERAGLIYSFDMESSEQLWEANLGGITASNIIETEDLLYVVTSEEKNTEVGKKNVSVENDLFQNHGSSVLWAIDKRSGVTMHRVDVPGDLKFYLFKNDKAICLINNFQAVVFDESLDGLTKKFAFEKNLVGEPFIDREKNDLYLIFQDEILKLVFSENKLSVEKIITSAGKSPINVFAVSEDNYFAGDETGNLSAYRKADKSRIWKFRAGGKISDIDIFADRLVISSFDNFLYCLSSVNGKHIWKKRLPGRISEVNKLTDADFFVRSSYSPDYYLIGVSSGDILEQYIYKPEGAASEIRLETSMRLIMILKSHSIDIYDKN